MQASATTSAREHMQEVWLREHLPPPARQEPMQGMPRGGGCVDVRRAGGARGTGGRWAKQAIHKL